MTEMEQGVLVLGQEAFIKDRKEDPVWKSGREEKGGRVILPTGDSAYSSV